MQERSRWQNVMIKEFGAKEEALNALSEEQAQELQREGESFVKNPSDRTRDRVLLLLQSMHVPSLLVTSELYRLGHLRDLAKQDDVIIEKVLFELKRKFSLPCGKEHVDVINKKVILGGGFALVFEFHSDQIHWILLDEKTQHQVKISYGDPSEKYGIAMQECHERRMEWLREMRAPKQVLEGEDSPVWHDAYSESLDAPQSGEEPG